MPNSDEVMAKAESHLRMLSLFSFWLSSPLSSSSSCIGVDLFCVIFGNLAGFVDIGVLAICIIELTVHHVAIPAPLSLLRFIRLVRVELSVRLMKSFRHLGLIIDGLVASVRVIFWAYILLFLFIIVTAILMVRFAHWPNMQARQGNQFGMPSGLED